MNAWNRTRARWGLAAWVGLVVLGGCRDSGDILNEEICDFVALCDGEELAAECLDLVDKGYDAWATFGFRTGLETGCMDVDRDVGLVGTAEFCEVVPEAVDACIDALRAGECTEESDIYYLLQWGPCAIEELYVHPV